MSLRWSQVDLFERKITVGRAKTSSGAGRTIPINDELAEVLAAHRTWFISRFGELASLHCVFPFGSPQPTNALKPTTDISSGWDLIRKAANGEVPDFTIFGIPSQRNLPRTVFLKAQCSH